MIVITVEDVASAVTVLTGLTGSHLWIYRRGRIAGRKETLLEERLERLERKLEDRPPPDRPRGRRRRWLEDKFRQQVQRRLS